MPGRAIAARHRTASEPYLSRMSVGTTTLPLDLLIFLRSGSTTKPEMVARFHGSEPFSKWARTTRLKSQVRMMSWACGATSIGKVSEKSSSSRSQPVARWGVSDDVAQVSMTSGSAMNPPGWSRCSALKPGGQSVTGSIGSEASSATIGAS